MTKAKLKQKEWFTLSDACSYLAKTTENGDVSELDIIQRAMDQELTLSIRVTRPGSKAIDFAAMVPVLEMDDEMQAEYAQLEPHTFFSKGMAPSISTHRFDARAWEMEKEFLYPQIWDINYYMGGQDFLADLWIERKKNDFIDPEEVGCFEPKLRNANGGEIKFTRTVQLYNDFFDTCALPVYLIPENSYLGVWRQELHRLFVDANESPEKPAQPHHDRALGTRERNTYLRMLRVLFEYDETIDLEKNSKTADQLLAMAELKGLPIPSKRTLENVIKAIRDNP